MKKFVLNDLVGWVIMFVSIGEIYLDNFDYSLGFLILAKLCFIHADIQKKKYYIK